MSLPNPGMSFTPFDPLPASDLNDLVENIEALAAGTGLNDLAVITAKLADAAVTTRKLKPSIIDYKDTGGTNFTTTSGSLVDITGMTTTYTTGPTAETLILLFSCMANNSAASAANLVPHVNGTDLTDETFWYPTAAGEWVVAVAPVVINVPANTIINLKGRAKTAGGTLTVNRATAYKVPSISGFAVSQ